MSLGIKLEILSNPLNGQSGFSALRRDAKTTKTNADKLQLCLKTVEMHLGIQKDNSDSKHLDDVNQFINDNHEYFHPLKTLMITEQIWMMTAIL